VVAVGVAIGGCTTDTSSEVSSRIEEKRFALSSSATLAIGVLRGKLSDMTIVQQVNSDTGEVVSLPQLRGTLSVLPES
jgi:hypothetical protein